MFIRVRLKSGKAFHINRRRVAIFVAVLAALFLGVTLALTSLLPSKERPPVTEINNIPVKVDLLKKGCLGRPGVKRKIKYIVIHETGNSGYHANAASHNSYLHRAAKQKQLSWHYTVDDHEIYQHLPDNEIGFHAGDGYKKNGGNMNGIGIEMCVNPDNDYEQTLKNTQKLVAYLMDYYHLSKKDVKKHQDFSGKICPEKLIKENRWISFQNDI